ncbi:MAG: caspase family protein [Methylocystaceae bacterium]|nr:caspase family protein [Methylocystaceae bacterium]
MKALTLLITSSLLWAALSGTAQSAEQKNDDVAIIIGNKTYEDKDIPEVSFALNDAKAMRSFVKDVLKIRDENIIYLENATQAKMQTAFGSRNNHRGKAFQYVKPHVSNLYVFYSGHGLPGQHDDKSYLLPVDAEIETADINGYPTDVLYQNLAQVDAKSVTVFLDACFSGNSQGGALITRASGAQILPNATPVPQKKGLTVITAASKDQLASWDEENKHGLFTEYLLRALYGEADTDKNGEIKLEEVSNYLNEEMRYKARRTYNRDQIPTIMGDEEQVLAMSEDGKFPTRPEIIEDTPAINTSAFDLTPVEENMFAVKNANVRALPNVRSAKVAMLNKGEPIHVAAKVTDLPWYAVESGDEIIGYVFADLLGEEKEIATEEENRAIRELKARLEKLEEQTRLSSQDILPAPPNNDEKSVEVVERVPNQPDWSNPYDRITKTLKSMGALLAKQNFIEKTPEINGTTSFNYNWIRIDADRCKISASVSLQQRAALNKTIRVQDHQISANFWNELNQKKRIIQLRNAHGEIIKKITLFSYGPFSFKDRADRKKFKTKAHHLLSLCPTPRHVSNDDINPSVYNTSPVMRDRPQRPPAPPFKRPPPPPQQRRY